MRQETVHACPIDKVTVTERIRRLNSRSLAKGVEIAGTAFCSGHDRFASRPPMPADAAEMISECSVNCRKAFRSREPISLLPREQILYHSVTDPIWPVEASIS